ILVEKYLLSKANHCLSYLIIISRNLLIHVFPVLLPKGVFIPDLIFKHCSLSVYEKSEFAALSWSKNAACHASCPRFIPKQKKQVRSAFCNMA
ncbi:hypothetical protein, partial [Klebsiella pneumoniae]|uniref:hypothetical protein n=1 Tax=Klebsiella pneumoniae TaxID=573 RepID=UPI002232B337